MPELSEKAEALAKALDLLARREHSSYELRCKLRVRGFDDAVVNDVVEVVRDKAYLSDARFAEAYIQTRVSKGYGEHDIRAHLRERGIDDTLASACLREVAVDWTEVAVVALTRKLGLRSAVELTQQRGRYARFLQSRGFTSEQTARAMRSLEREAAAVDHGRD